MNELPHHHRPYAESYRRAGWWTSQPVPDRLASMASSDPERLAVVDDGTRLNYREFDALVTRAACGFLAHGFKPGDVVALQLPNRYEYAIYQQAAVRAGLVYLPLTPQLREADLGYLMKTANARMLIIPRIYRGFDHSEMLSGLRASVPTLQSAIIVDDGTKPEGALLSTEFLAVAWEEQYASRLSHVARDPDSIRQIIFTSGTESKPKAVLHSHNTILFPLANHTRLFKFTRDDVVFTPSPVGHGTGAVFGVELALYFGGTVVLMDGWNPSRAVEIISRERCSLMWGATTFFSDLLNVPDLESRDLSAFRLLMTAGAPIPAGLVQKVAERIGGQLVSAYGQSEGQNITITRLDDPAEKIVGSDGKFQDGIDFKLVDQSGNSVNVGEEGEILYRGPNLCLGYLEPEHNENAFTPDGYIRSGDLGIVDADGYLRIVGRRKEIIIRGGENISPAEIENYLFKHPAIASVAVVGLPDERLGQRACAAVIPHPGQTVKLQDIIDFMASQGVAKFKYPEDLVIVSQLPRTLTGKVQRDVLLASILEQKAQNRKPAET